MRLLLLLPIFIFMAGCSKAKMLNAGNGGDFSKTYRDVTNEAGGCKGMPRFNSLYGTWNKQLLGDKGDVMQFQYEILSTGVTHASKTCIIPGVGPIKASVTVPSKVVPEHSQYIVLRGASYTQTAMANGAPLTCTIDMPAGAAGFQFSGDCVGFLGAGQINYFTP